jgi:ABC-type nitrate/sulfonate/bicarbonate transport system substrate-binding protein
VPPGQRPALDESLKKQGIAVRWVEFPAGPQMLEGLNVGSIDLFQALIQGAAIFQQREDVRLLIADVDGLRRFGQRGI